MSCFSGTPDLGKSPFFILRRAGRQFDISRDVGMDGRGIVTGASPRDLLLPRNISEVSARETIWRVGTKLGGKGRNPTEHLETQMQNWKTEQGIFGEDRRTKEGR